MSAMASNWLLGPMHIYLGAGADHRRVGSAHIYGVQHCGVGSVELDQCPCEQSVQQLYF